MDQATRAGNELRGIKIEVILCSPLPYAWQTAREVAELHLDHIPPVESIPELISAHNSTEETVTKNIKKVMKQVLQKFRGKTVLLVSHKMVGQAFLAYHLEENLEVARVHWPTIEHGQMVCRQIIED